MFCDKCGTENRDEAEFCTNCGNKLVRDNVTPVRPSSPGEGHVTSELDYVARFKSAVSDRYEVIREIGRGGMAIVFLAKDTRLERKVALKLLPHEIAMDKNYTERFMREAKISAKLAHPNIIQIHDVDNVGEFTYYSMSYIEGISLAHIIKKGGALAPKIVTRLGIQICFALQQAHEKGVIHRDIKPENILINKKRMPIVVDFGIARAMSDSRLSSTGMFIGTPQYMSPEQIQGTEVDARSDIYCMGVMLYEMATGKPPFRGGDTASLMYKHVHETPPPPHEINRKVPENLSAAIMKALEKDPANRYQSAMEFGRTLHEVSKTPEATVQEEGTVVAAKTGKKQEPAEIENIVPPGGDGQVSEKTMLMQKKPRPGEPVEDAEGIDGGTVAMKKPVKKVQAPVEEEKKGTPVILQALLIAGLLSIIAFGSLKLLQKPTDTLKITTSPPSLEQPPASQTETQPAAPSPPREKQAAPRSQAPPAKPPRQSTGQASQPVSRPTPTVPAETPATRPSSTRQAPVTPRPEPTTPEPRQSPARAAAPSPADREPVPTPSQPAQSTPSRPVSQPKATAAQTPRPATPVPTPSTEPEPADDTGLLARRVEPKIPEPEPQPTQPSPAPSSAAIYWVSIPGGTFEMGDFIGDLRSEVLCQPVHRVTVSPFELSRDEVTVSQYAVFVGETGHPEPRFWREQLARPDRPVIYVSWNDAVAFAKWVGARLPTEAEWEFAARGGLVHQKYPWGSESPDNRANLGHDWGNEGDGWRQYLKPPGTYPPNAFGLNDMAGNVWEWTADRFGPYSPGLSVNPAGSSTGNLRVMRGGAWNSTESFIRNAFRGPSQPGFKGPHVGFRIAR